MNPYNAKRIAWELERTAMGDGFHGDALRAAKDIPTLTPEDRSLLDRYATGHQTAADSQALQQLAMRIYTAPARRPRGTVAPDDKAKIRSVRLTDAQWEKFNQLGGPAWLRSLIEHTPAPSRYRPDISQCSSCTHLFEPCELNMRFDTMPPVRHDIDGIIRVRCSGYAGYPKDEPQKKE